MSKRTNGRHRGHSNGNGSQDVCYEWGNEKHPLKIDAWRQGDIWVASEMGAYFYTETMISKIAHVMDYHGDDLTTIRVELELRGALR